MKLINKKKNHHLIATTLFNIGSMYLEKKEFDKAHNFTQEPL